MKVIDLLNKIANGEIYIGTHIIYRDKEFIFTGSCLENIKENSAIAMFGLDNLNNEVEIIEEDKKIENIKDSKQIKSMEELKKELGNKYDEVMYKMNIELLDRLDRAVKLTNWWIEGYEKEGYAFYEKTEKGLETLLDILQGSDKA